MAERSDLGTLQFVNLHCTTVELVLLKSGQRLLKGSESDAGREGLVGTGEWDKHEDDQCDLQ